VSNTPRNEPCPCGSGRKYKKCCLARDNAAATERLNTQRAGQDRLDQERLQLSQLRREHAAALDALLEDDERLLELTNGVLDLVRDKRFDEALSSCKRLLEEYPEVIDGLERSGLVHEALGNHALAADFYRQCIEFIERPDQREHFEEASIDFYRGKIAKLEQLIRSA
jgi:tetratricopeptide (TPR) repeat protein